MSSFQPNYIVVSPLPMDITANAIWQHFAKFGDVVHVGIHQMENCRIANVFYSQADAALNATTIKHILRGHEMQASMADDAQESSNLLNLNDDCLEDIMRRLELKDLCSFASVCERLQERARAVYSMKWRNTELNISSLEEAQMYLMNFGPVMKTLQLVPTKEFGQSHSDDILNLLMNHCTDALTRLELHNIKFSKKKETIAKPKLAFSRVHTLVLTRCAISVKWLITCAELMELELIASSVSYDRARNHLCPKLETLKIYEGSKSWVNAGLLLFIQQNQQLKSLTLFPENCHRDYRSVNANGFERIEEFLPATMESLSINASERTQLARFRSLKRLEIHGILVPVVNRLENHTLEYLELDYYKNDHNYPFTQIVGFTKQNAHAVSQLIKLKSLKIRCNRCENEDLIYMVRHLTELTYLQLDTRQNNIEGNHLREVIQHGQKLQKILLIFRRDGEKLKIDAQTYKSILNRRSLNGKPLQIVLSGSPNLIKQTDLTFPMQPALQIVCEAPKYVHPTFYIHRDWPNCSCYSVTNWEN